MSEPQSDGSTLRDHYEMLAERTGRSVAEIARLPDIPIGCEGLWGDFLSLSMARGSNGFGPSRITWADIDAYQRVHHIRFMGWEIEALRRIDSAFMSQAAKRKPQG